MELESPVFFLRKLYFETKLDNLAKTTESQVQSKNFKNQINVKGKITKLPKFLRGK